MNTLLDLFGIEIYYDPESKTLIPGSDVSYEEYNRKYSRDMLDLLSDISYKKEDTPFYDFYKGFIRNADSSLFANFGLRHDVTVIMEGEAGSEFKKTSGHFHEALSANSALSYPELYQVIKGKALFIMQKVDDYHKLNDMKIKDVVLAEANAGEGVVIPPGYGHCTVNISSEPLIFINLVSVNSCNYYDSIHAHAGMCMYVKEWNNSRKGYILEQNSHYTFECIPRIATPVDCPQLGIIKGASAYLEFVKNPFKFSYLNFPEINTPDYFSCFSIKQELKF